jgi:glycosyl transferase family 25
MNTPTITFVTAFIDLNEHRPKDRTPEIRTQLFRQLAKSGISICLYVSSKYENIGKELANEYKNIKLMPITNLEDTETYKIITKFNPVLPINRCQYKDTLNYMILQNAKSEFVYNAILNNPYNTDYFAWIDFSICHVLNYNNSNDSIDNNTIHPILQKLYNSSISIINLNTILLPSCFSFEKSKYYFNLISSHIIWRFCGGFFIGDKKSLQNMHLLMLKELPNFITQNRDNNNNNNNNNIISWEVNVWVWLEHKCNWIIDTYQADHNESILDIPDKYITNNINTTENTETNLNHKNEQLQNQSCINKYIDKVFYINLEYRTDRKKEIEDELNNSNISYERFNAILTPDFGIVGCTKSHLEVLKIARAKKYKTILIVEDDFKFIVSKDIIEKNIKLLFDTRLDNSTHLNTTNPIDFDVCMLSYNLIKSESYNEAPFLTKVLEVQTASGYIVNESIYDKLIELYEYAIPLLESTKQHWIYANDQIWKRLQPNSKWYCFTERLGIQRPSYSDNGKSFCDLGC